MFKYLASLIKNDTGNSSKSFTLVLSAIISFIAGLTICGILIYDAYCNGYIKTDLEKAGIFMLCMGAFMAGSGVPKIFGERSIGKIKSWNNDNYDEEYFQHMNKHCGYSHQNVEESEE